MARRLTPERLGLKEEARRLRRRGYSGAAIALRQGVPERTVRRWIGGHNTSIKKLAVTSTNGHNAPTWIVAASSIETYQGGPFDLIVADPPWAVSKTGGGFRSKKNPSKLISRDFGQWDHFSDDRTYYRTLQGWLQAMYCLAAEDTWLVLWLDYLKVSEIVSLARKLGWRYRNVLFWCKSNPHPAGGQQLLQAVECALLLNKGNPRLAVNAHEQVPNFFTFPVVAGSRRFRASDGTPFNRAEKPVALLRLWVEYLSKPGDWVLDAFSGSGACTEAAVLIGRNVVAVEAEQAQCKAIEARILRVTNDYDIKGIKSSQSDGP